MKRPTWHGIRFSPASLLIMGAALSIVLLPPSHVLGEGVPPAPNDPLFAGQKRLFDKLNVLEAWSLTKGNPDVLVGVVDNGFDYFHPDLKGQLIPGSYAPGGYHTEIALNIGHGTIVSSIIGATANNGIGMAGLAPGCRVLACSHGMIENFIMKLQSEYMKEHPDVDFAEGLAEGMKMLARRQEEVQEFGKKWNAYISRAIVKSISYCVYRKAKVINISGGPFTKATLGEEHFARIAKAFKYAEDNGVILVLAAGNMGIPFEGYPGGDLTIVVGGCAGNKRWEHTIEMGRQSMTVGSAYGPELTLVAPVEGVVMCLPHDKRHYSADDSPGGESNEEFKGMYETGNVDSGTQGTSIAAPIVSSLVALVYSLRPDLDAKTVVEIIKQGCDDIGEKGKDIHTGHGRVNFLKTLEIARNYDK